MAEPFIGCTVEGSKRRVASLEDLVVQGIGASAVELFRIDIPNGFRMPEGVQVVDMTRCRGVDEMGRLPRSVHTFFATECMLSKCSHLVSAGALEQAAITGER